MSKFAGIPSCAPYDTLPYNSYGYKPSLAAGIIFSIIFCSICIAQITQTVITRSWWMGFFIIGAGLECLGWIGRTIAHNCVYSSVISTMQTATLIMGPAWTQSGVYIALWAVVTLVGRHISPLPPKTYLFIIFWVDVVCLSLQAVGGGIAGGANESGGNTQTGTTIMVVGIIAQLVSGCVFAVFLAIVIFRAWTDLKKKENGPILLAIIAIVVSTAMMILRGFYRSVELCQGWTGYLISHEGYIIGLDAAPMVVAMGTLCVINPGMLFSKIRRRRECRMLGLHGLPEEKADVASFVPFDSSPEEDKSGAETV